MPIVKISCLAMLGGHEYAASVKKAGGELPMTTWELAEGMVLDLKAVEAERMAKWLEAVGQQQHTVAPPEGGRKINRWVEETFEAKLVLIQASRVADDIRRLLAFKAKLRGRR